jgi:hypothetical protein
MDTIIECERTCTRGVLPMSDAVDTRVVDFETLCTALWRERQVRGAARAVQAFETTGDTRCILAWVTVSGLVARLLLHMQHDKGTP